MFELKSEQEVTSMTREELEDYTFSLLMELPEEKRLSILQKYGYC